MQGYRYLIRNVAGSIILKCRTYQEALNCIDDMYENHKSSLRLLCGCDIPKKNAYDIVDLKSIKSLD